MIAVVFLSALAIGIGVVYSVRNVNVSVISYSGEEDAKAAISEIKLSVSEEFEGKVISFVDETDVRECVEKEFTVNCAQRKYVMENFKKVYPCTLNVTVKERRATYAVKSANGFDVYDEDGLYLRASEENINETQYGGDGAPFVVLEGVSTDDERDAVVGLCTAFGSEENFSAIRAAVERVELVKSQSTIGADRLNFFLRCGLTVVVQDYANSGAEKIARAAKEFTSLTGEQKLSGTIYCHITAEGVVEATYGKNVNL